MNWIFRALETAPFKMRIDEQLKLETSKSMKRDPVAAGRWITHELKLFLKYSVKDYTKPRSEMKRRAGRRRS